MEVQAIDRPRPPTAPPDTPFRSGGMRGAIKLKFPAKVQPRAVRVLDSPNRLTEARGILQKLEPARLLHNSEAATPTVTAEPSVWPKPVA